MQTLRNILEVVHVWLCKWTMKWKSVEKSVEFAVFWNNFTDELGSWFASAVGCWGRSSQRPRLFLSHWIPQCLSFNLTGFWDLGKVMTSLFPTFNSYSFSCFGQLQVRNIHESRIWQTQFLVLTIWQLCIMHTGSVSQRLRQGATGKFCLYSTWYLLLHFEAKREHYATDKSNSWCSGNWNSSGLAQLKFPEHLYYIWLL